MRLLLRLISAVLLPLIVQCQMNVTLSLDQVKPDFKIKRWSDFDLCDSDNYDYLITLALGTSSLTLGPTLIFSNAAPAAANSESQPRSFDFPTADNATFVQSYADVEDNTLPNPVQFTVVSQDYPLIKLNLYIKCYRKTTITQFVDYLNAKLEKLENSSSEAFSNDRFFSLKYTVGVTCNYTEDGKCQLCDKAFSSTDCSPSACFCRSPAQTSCCECANRPADWICEQVNVSSLAPTSTPHSTAPDNTTATNSTVPSTASPSEEEMFRILAIVLGSVAGILLVIILGICCIAGMRKERRNKIRAKEGQRPIAPEPAPSDSVYVLPRVDEASERVYTYRGMPPQNDDQTLPMRPPPPPYVAPRKNRLRRYELERMEPQVAATDETSLDASSAAASSWSYKPRTARV